MSTIKRFEDMEVWQLSRELCQKLYSICRRIEENKDWELCRQLSRSSGSCMDNIAEGFGRAGNKEFKNFLAITSGSVNEVKSQLYRVLDRNYISESEFNALYELADKLHKKTRKLISYLAASELKGVKFREGEVSYTTPGN